MAVRRLDRRAAPGQLNRPARPSSWRLPAALGLSASLHLLVLTQTDWLRVHPAPPTVALEVRLEPRPAPPEPVVPPRPSRPSATRAAARSPGGEFSDDPGDTVAAPVTRPAALATAATAAAATAGQAGAWSEAPSERVAAATGTAAPAHLASAGPAAPGDARVAGGAASGSEDAVRGGDQPAPARLAAATAARTVATGQAGTWSAAVSGGSGSATGRPSGAGHLAAAAPAATLPARGGGGTASAGDDDSGRSGVPARGPALLGAAATTTMAAAVLRGTWSAAPAGGNAPATATGTGRLAVAGPAPVPVALRTLGGVSGSAMSVRRTDQTGPGILAEARGELASGTPRPAAGAASALAEAGTAAPATSSAPAARLATAAAASGPATAAGGVGAATSATNAPATARAQARDGVAALVRAAPAAAGSPDNKAPADAAGSPAGASLRAERASAGTAGLAEVEAVRAMSPDALEGAPSDYVFSAALAGDGQACFGYNLMLRRAGLEGRVELRIQVDATGQPVQVALAAGSGDARLDRHAIEQARKCARFVVRNRRGQPVAATLRLPVRYRINQ